MTTEEFHGHLMAALHGPKADEVARRVFELTVDGLSQPDSKIEMANQVKGLIDVVGETFGILELMKMVQALAMLAVADQITMSVGETDASARGKRDRRKEALTMVVRSTGREMYLDPFKDRLEEVEGGSIIADLFGDD